jgi:hypothetical protein
MATVRVPPNVSSVTLTTSGAVVPAGGIITCTALEATELNLQNRKGPGLGVIDSAATTCRLQLPTVITSITINGNVIAVVNGVSGAVNAADAAAFILGMKQCAGAFQLVTG